VAKQILYNEKARAALKRGVDQLANAASAATMFLTTKAVITDIPEEKKEKSPVPPDMTRGI